MVVKSGNRLFKRRIISDVVDMNIGFLIWQSLLLYIILLYILLDQKPKLNQTSWQRTTLLLKIFKKLDATYKENLIEQNELLQMILKMIKMILMCVNVNKV